MWVTRTARVLGITTCRRSSAFFELYGRAPATQPEEAKSDDANSVLSCSTAEPARNDDWANCQALLEQFRTQVYANPNHVTAQLSRDTLAAMTTVLSASPLRRSAAASTLWQSALDLYARTSAPDVASAADAAAILLLSDQAARARELCWTLLRNSDFHLSAETSDDVIAALRFLSVCLMSADVHSAKPMHASLCSLIEAVLVSARRAIASAEKSQRGGLAHEVETVAWALDWCYSINNDFVAAAVLHRLRPLLPQWLLFLFDDFNPSAPPALPATTAALAHWSPRCIAEQAQCAFREHDHRALERLLRHVEHREAATVSYRLFQLSAHVAGLLVQRFPHLPSSARAVETYQTALRCDALRPFGATRDGFDKTVGVLTAMTGAEPYAVLRGLLRTHSDETAAAVQEAAGDVLTGAPQLNWSTALGFTMGQVEGANPHWRTYLPETLRLLSDAGKAKQFWTLLREYNAGDAASNLSVAASLAQTMQRSGRWWHAMEVLDLVAAAPQPQNTAEKFFLSSACADTLRALVHAKRWQQALEVFALTVDVLPRQESSVVSQLLTSLPADAPWTDALLQAEKSGFAVENTRALLTVLHGGDASAVKALATPPQQRAAVALFSQQGRYDLTRALLSFCPGDVHVWRGLLQALEHCPGPIEEAEGRALLSAVPPSLLHDPRTFAEVAQLCLQHAWLSVLTSHVEAAAESSSADVVRLGREYGLLLRYVQSGERPPMKFVFADPYVVHQFIACVAARQLSVVAALPPPVDASKKSASAYLRVPHENLGALHRSASGEGNASSTIKVYSVAASSFLKEHLLWCSADGDGTVCGYKVPGASLFATARGLLQELKLTGVYMVAYNMSAASSGIFVLHPAAVSVREYVFSLRVRVCLANLADAPLVPLLATSFFKMYEMRWCAGTRDRHEVEAVIALDSGVEVRGALRTLKRDINAEGWGLVESEAGAGDLYHVCQVQYTRRGGAGLCEPQLIACGPRSLQPINADAESVSWTDQF